MKMVPLGELCAITMGQAPSGESYNDSREGLPLIAGAGDFDGDVPRPKKFTSAPAKVSARGDIIMGIRASIGDCVWSDREYCLGRGVVGLRTSSGLSSRYLWHWLRHAAPSLAAKGRGATFLQVNRRDIAEMAVPLPPLDEQRRIAAILDQADALRTKRRQALGQLDELTQAIFMDMFGDPASCDTCERLPLDELLVDIDSGSSPVCEARPATGDEWAVLKLGAISYGEFNPAENKAFLGDVASMQQAEVQPGDFLFSRKNTKELVGATVIVYDTPPRLLLPDLIFRLRLDTERLLPEYLHALLRSPRKRLQLVALASGSASSMVNISQARLRTLIIEVPPIERQREYASRLLSVRQRLRLCRVAVRELDELFASLQSRAFSGQL